ncbi:hypothetical protein Bbelb_415190, partial [Branchiostoma belcheri]
GALKLTGHLLWMERVTVDPAWRSVDGLLKFVSVGSRGVWGVNRNDDIFYRSGTLENKASSGSGWVKIEGKLKQISSGHSVWGVNANDDIFIRQGVTSTNPTGTDWLHVGGKLKQLDVSSTANQLWGVNSNDNIYRRTGVSTDQPAGTDWELIEGLLKFVSVGPAGVWGVNSNDDIFYRTGTFGNEASSGSGWEHIQGKLKQISSGDNIVWGVNVNNDIFVREGISPSTPAGTGWRQIPGKLKQVEAGLSGRLAWGVNSGDSIFLRTQPTELQLPSIDGYSVRHGDCPGNDIWSIYGDGITLADCADRCRSHPDCVSFMFFDNKRCFPKTKTCRETSKDNPKNVFYDKNIAQGSVAAANEFGFEVFPHPSNSPDLAPSDFYQFPKLKFRLRGQCFYGNDDVISACELGAPDDLPTVDGYTVRAGDCPGNDIWSIYGDGMTLADCADRCRSHPDCVSFMFFDNKRCFPKTKTCRETSKDNPKNVFYDKESDPLPTASGYTVRAGDCPGNDIWSIYGDGMTLADCADRCRSHPDCVSFMFFDNKRCFPKTKTCRETSKDNPKNVFYDKNIGADFLIQTASLIQRVLLLSSVSITRGGYKLSHIWDSVLAAKAPPTSPTYSGEMQYSSIGPTAGRIARRPQAGGRSDSREGRDRGRCGIHPMKAFDNGFRTGPYRKVRPGPEPVIERHRGPEPPPVVIGFSVRHGDCPGNDIWSIYGDGITLSDCADRCRSHPDCVSFMFFDNKRCFPKTKTCQETSKDNPKNVFYDKDVVSVMASSERGPGFPAKNSRLGLQETATSAGAWSAQKPWLRFDLGRPKTVTNLVTQGRSYSPDWPGESHSEWVTSYSISYGNENGDEAWYTGDDGQAIVFKANTDRDSKVRQDLSEFSGPFTARYVKIHPLTWHGWVSMRAGIGTEPPSWSASSEWDSLHSADRADINSRETADAAGAWAAATNDQDQWLMRDLGDVSVITGVITKGRNYSPDWPWDKHDQYVTSYTISYGNENGDETFYTDADGQVTVFPANDDRDTEVYNDFVDFSGRITARFVKIHPQTWHEHISMRAKIVTVATQKWREDLRCGAGYTTADGRTAECDPDSIYPCCSPNNWCGNTADHCDCAGCVDYRDT